MLPVWNAYGQWPASGEIDIMESRGTVSIYDKRIMFLWSYLKIDIYQTFDYNSEKWNLI